MYITSGRCTTAQHTAVHVLYVHTMQYVLVVRYVLVVQYYTLQYMCTYSNWYSGTSSVYNIFPSAWHIVDSRSCSYCYYCSHLLLSLLLLLHSYYCCYLCCCTIVVTIVVQFFMSFAVVYCRSLGRLFPNLRVIRGNRLVREYALVIQNNTDLQTIDLSSKLRTLRSLTLHLFRIFGFVRSFKNKFCCRCRFISFYS